MILLHITDFYSFSLLLTFQVNVANTSCILRTIGDTCMEQSDCFNAVENSKCVSGKCDCIAGFHAQNDGSLCNIRKIFSSGCRNNKDCSTAVANSSCRYDTCLCLSGFHVNNLNTTCTLRE